jgi:hypothetical protein
MTEHELAAQQFLYRHPSASEAETGEPSGAEGDLFRQAVVNSGAPDGFALSRAAGSSGLRR